MTNTVFPTNPVGWFDIHVSDMERAKKFYENVLQIHLEKLTPTPGSTVTQMYAFPMSAGASGACGSLVKGQEMRSGNGGTVVYFTCEDCAVEAGRVGPSGGKIVAQKMPIGAYGFVAIAADTEGNTIGLHSRK